MLARNGKTWNRMIVLLIQQAQPSQALQKFWQMETEGVEEPNAVTFACLFKACADLGDRRQGQCLHLQFYERKCKGNIVVANSMINMYAKCGDLILADNLFMAMPRRNLVTWNSLIAGYVQHGYPTKAFVLLHQMHGEGLHPDEMTYSSILKVCASQGLLECGQLVHMHAIRQGHEHNRFVANTLIDLYSKCGVIEDALRVFREVPRRDVISWTSIITGHAELAHVVLALFQQMLCEGVHPNKCTFVSILNGCASLKDLEVGKRVHCQVKERDYDHDNAISSTLIHMYGECGSIHRAHQVFEMAPKGNLIPWTMMIGVHGNQEMAGQLCGRMWKENIEPDASAFVCILKAWASLNSFMSIKIAHSHVTESNLESNIFVGSTLVDGYAKCGSIEDAAVVFDRLKNWDVTPWALMMAGYVQSLESEKALALFWQMQRECIQPSKPSFLAAMNACVHQTCVEEGRLIHYLLIASKLESDVPVRNSVMEFCAKIGDIEDVQLMFDTMEEPNTVSWTMIIIGYAQQGHANEAFHLLQQMQLQGVDPDGFTFTGVFSACSHEGLVEAGFYHFSLMIRYHGIMPSGEHYSCMVDLLGRAGCMEEALEFISKAPVEPSAVLWRSLYSACDKHGSHL